MLHAAPSSESVKARVAYTDGLVSVFADLAEMFGNPRSYGQIYGFLFSKDHPLTMEEIARRLGISQGSVSQGLRQLEAFGAVVKEKSEGGRQARYAARLEMKLLIAGFLRERVIPRLESTEARIRQLRIALENQGEDLDQAFLQTANHRLERVAKWHRSARTLMPIARKILGGG